MIGSGLKIPDRTETEARAQRAAKAIAAPLPQHKVQAILVAARSWPTDDAIKLIQDTFTGRVEPEAFVVADLPRCPRCDGVCGRIQCSEGMKTPGARRAA